MRHFVANIVTYTIAALLVLGAAAFGLVRSEQLVLTREARLATMYEPAPDREFRWQELGRAMYVRNCANCHQPRGQGWDQYPPLGDASELFVMPGGREYLIDLHLWGVVSDRFRAPMPRMRHLTDVELAAVMNYVLTAFGNIGAIAPDADLYVPSDVAQRREPRLSPREVNDRRPGG